MLNLSFDKEMRSQMFESGLLPKLANIIGS